MSDIMKLPDCILDVIASDDLEKAERMGVAYCKHFKVEENKILPLMSVAVPAYRNKKAHTLNAGIQDRITKYCQDTLEFSCISIKNDYKCGQLCEMCRHGENKNKNKAHEENVLAYLIQALSKDHSNKPIEMESLTVDHFKSVITINDNNIPVYRRLFEKLGVINMTDSDVLELFKSEHRQTISSIWSTLRYRRVNHNVFKKSMDKLLSEVIISKRKDPTNHIKAFIPFNENIIALQETQKNADVVSINIEEENNKKDHEVKKNYNSKPAPKVETEVISSKEVIKLNSEINIIPPKDKINISDTNVIVSAADTSSTSTEIKETEKETGLNEPTKEDGSPTQGPVEIVVNDKIVPPKEYIDINYEVISDFQYYNDHVHYELAVSELVGMEIISEHLCISFTKEERKYYYALLLSEKQIFHKLESILINENIVKVSSSFALIKNKFQKSIFHNCIDLRLAFGILHSDSGNDLYSLATFYMKDVVKSIETYPCTNRKKLNYIQYYKELYLKIHNELLSMKKYNEYNHEFLFYLFMGRSLTLPLKNKSLKSSFIDTHNYDFLKVNNLSISSFSKLLDQDYVILSGSYENLDVALQNKFADSIPEATFRGYSLKNKNYIIALTEELYRDIIIDIMGIRDLWIYDFFLIRCSGDGIVLACKDSLGNILFDILNQSMSLNFKKHFDKEYPKIAISITKGKP